MGRCGTAKLINTPWGKLNGWNWEMTGLPTAGAASRDRRDHWHLPDMLVDARAGNDGFAAWMCH
jgi:hypothetical protein